MITKKEIRGFWAFFWILMIRWASISLFFILSVLAIPVSLGAYLGGASWWWYLALYGLAVPLNFLLKYGFGIRNLWFFNNTKDGDFGNLKILEDYGHENRSKLFKFIWWWFRNICWNFIRQFKPPWDAGEVQEHLMLIDTLINKNEYGIFTRADKEKKNYGIKHIAYRIDGKVCCQYSKATKKYQIQIGSGGSEYRFKIKL